MKTKLLTLAGAIILASTSWAEVLYWQVGDTPGIDPEDWSYATIFQTTGKTVGGGTALANLTGDSPNPTKIDSDTALQSPVAAILSSGYTTANFYIELYSSQSSNQPVGWSQQVVSYAELQSFITTQGMSVKSPDGRAAYRFTAVPEPTSGLMLLLGAAMLGLRRKRIA